MASMKRQRITGREKKKKWQISVRGSGMQAGEAEVMGQA